MSRINDEIVGLDPATEYERIGFLLGAFEFHTDLQLALQFALFRTYAVPAISRILSRTGEFVDRPRKRYDDTEILMAEMGEHGLDSERGEEAITRMNDMHGRYRIPNHQMVYVLTALVLEPKRWIERFGWRALTGNEILAGLHFYRALGARMGVTDIPDTIEAMQVLNRAYEAEHFEYSDTNAEIGRATVDLYLSFYMPRWLYWLGRPLAVSMMDTPLRRAMGFADPPRPVQTGVVGLMKLRARVLRWLPRRRRAALVTPRRRPTYPGGYQIDQVGTFAFGKAPPDENATGTGGRRDSP